ncbi:cubilin-like [Haliotis rubra]|uniref:cubilin-like n=1 Tax=Haliotis rubra TaxID=36100 RepID=UPI001EE57099|nr:cubilin-like [Haliotis rubra]
MFRRFKQMLGIYKTIAVLLGTLSTLHAASTGDCGSRSLNATTHRQFIQSPGYPAGYASNEDCRWTITASTPDMMVRIEVIDSDIYSQDETYATCVPDGVEGFNGRFTLFGKILTWCGPSLPTFQSSSSTITIFFFTEASSLRRGFKLAYFETKERYHCGGILNITTTDYTTITSPNYPGPYRDHQDCRWVIHAPANTNIEARIRNTSIETDSSSQCTYGFLDIYDVVRSTLSGAGRFCGDDDTDYISSGHIIVVRFYSDGLFSRYKGFQMQLKAGHFKAFDTEELTASYSRKYIYSPNYPFYYPSNAEVGWKITADEDYSVTIDFMEFGLENSDSCTSDYLEAFDGSDSNAPSLGRWCGESKPNATSTGSVMFLKFKSDSSGVDRGFKIEYTVQYKSKHSSPGK